MPQSPAPPADPPPPPEPRDPLPGAREAAFLSGANAAARCLAQVGGFTNAGSLGYLAGSLVAAGAGASGPVTLVSALAGAAGAGVLGWKAMGRISDWAGQRGALLYPSNPLAGEALGRTSVNLAVDLLAGSRLALAMDLTVTAAWGGYKALRTQRSE